MNTEMDIRPSPIAGSWYPSDPDILRSSIEKYFQDAEIRELKGDIKGIIVPHAGHRYSGHIAALGFKHLQSLQPVYVAVISPIHHFVSARLLTSSHQAYSTPLGLLPVAVELVEQIEHHLDKEYSIRLKRIRNDQEHSLEIELPFLQQILASSFKLIPIMISEQSVEVAEALGSTLARVLEDKSALLVGSTDLSHFYPGSVANKFDTEMLSRIEAFDPVGVIKAEEEQFGFAYGRGAAAAALWACRSLGADTAQIVGYGTSGDVTGDYSSVVGYGSAVIYREENLQS